MIYVRPYLKDLVNYELILTTKQFKLGLFKNFRLCLLPQIEIPFLTQKKMLAFCILIFIKKGIIIKWCIKEPNIEVALGLTNIFPSMHNRVHSKFEFQVGYSN